MATAFSSHSNACSVSSRPTFRPSPPDMEKGLGDPRGDGVRQWRRGLQACVPPSPERIRAGQSHSGRGRRRHAGIPSRNGLTFGIVICYDSTFAEPAARMSAEGATVLFVPTNNRLPRSRAAEEIVAQTREADVARATENSIGSSGLMWPGGQAHYALLEHLESFVQMGPSCVPRRRESRTARSTSRQPVAGELISKDDRAAVGRNNSRVTPQWLPIFSDAGRNTLGD